MENIYRIRETLIKIYNNYRNILIIAAKAVLGVVMFTLINSLNYSSADFSIITSSPLTFPIIILLGFLFAVLPITFSYILITLYITVHFSAMLEVAVIIFIFAVCVYIFYARLAVKECIVILLILLGFKLHIEYAVVLLAGMYFSFTVIIPVAIGTFIWYAIPALTSTTNVTEIAISEIQSINIMELPENLSAVLDTLQMNIMADQAWIYYSFVFAMIIILVNMVSRLSIDYSKDIALLVGSVLNIFCIIIISIVAPFKADILSVIFFTVLSLLIAEAVKFFDVALDYQGSERLQFEDDENYYYVKVVPKLVMRKTVKRPVRKIVPQDEDI